MRFSLFFLLFPKYLKTTETIIPGYFWGDSPQKISMHAYNTAEAGVDVTYELFSNCQHGFTHEGFKEYRREDAERAWKLMGDFIKETMACGA